MWMKAVEKATATIVPFKLGVTKDATLWFKFS